MKRWRCMLLCAAALAAAVVLPQRAGAQYYSWGADAASLRWRTMKCPDVQVIFPDTAAQIARRTLFYIENVQSGIGYGFRHPALNLPFVLHPENFRSNGLVMWMPKRVEFLTTPDVESYAIPWLKHLVAHEYRHAVQYNNLDRGVIRALSYLLGQQGSFVGLAFMPLWAIEGDAVMSETEMASVGRGRQPSFTIAYRAEAENIARQRRNPDLWFCGSYRRYIPDHYQLGYQLCSYAYTHYGTNIWDRVAWYASRNPYLIVSTTVAMRKFYGTNPDKLFRSTFDDLYGFWSRLPAAEDSAATVAGLPEGNYTTYAHPVPLADGSLLALKSDFDRPSRFVRVDPATGAERRVSYTGALSTRPSVGEGRVWWTEYRRSKLFEERVNSQLCCMDLGKGRPRRVAGMRNVLYPTVTADGLARVTYTPDGRYTVVNAAGREQPFPIGTEVHGLAWDEVTQALYALITDDSGMWIVRIAAEGVEPVTKGAYVTLSDLRAGGGRLWFGSIASGKDEVHMLDLTENPVREYRLTTSKYGAFSPAPTADTAQVAVTLCDRFGYRLALQSVVRDHPVAYSPLPVDLVNPPRKRWEVINLDTVRFTPADSLASLQRHADRRYRKGSHIFHVHSWMPVSVDPFAAWEEYNLDFNVGATVLSQNLLSSGEGYLTYGWNRTDGSVVRGRFRYSGLGVRLNFSGTVGGRQLIYSLAQRNGMTGETERQPAPSARTYWSVQAGASLPLLFQQGYHNRQLSLSADWNYSNGLVARADRLQYDPVRGRFTNLATIGYRRGLQKLSFGVGFSDQVRLAHRDFAPRWGCLMQAGYALNPADRNFSSLLALYGKVWLPGILPHNSLRIAAAYQNALGGYMMLSGMRYLSYLSAYLLPHGYRTADIRNNHYTALSVNYELPLWCPDGGIPSVIYFKRIRMMLGYDWARFRTLAAAGEGSWRRIGAYGGNLTFDVNVFRQPAAATSSVTLSLWIPRDGSPWFSFGVGLPL